MYYISLCTALYSRLASASQDQFFAQCAAAPVYFSNANANVSGYALRDRRNPRTLTHKGGGPPLSAAPSVSHTAWDSPGFFSIHSLISAALFYDREPYFDEILPRNMKSEKYPQTLSL